MSKKVGIITFHNALNYGAILQTYALQTTLENLECTAVVLNYKNPYVSSTLRKPQLHDYHNPLNYRKDMKKYRLDTTKAHKLSEFSAQHLHVTHSLNDIDLVPFAQDLDLVITGSDQVWNDKITHNDDAFYLNFVEPSKRVSYAASIGSESISQIRVGQIYPFLREFKSISVRETQAQTALKRQLGLNVQRVLDPTLLLPADDYSKITTAPNGEKYILIYMLFYSESLIRCAKKMAAKLGYPVYCVNGSSIPLRGVQDFSNVGIEEWLGLLKNAQYIFTNSFHGVAFSINFEKQFTAELPPSRVNAGSRIMDLLDVLGLSNRILAEDVFEEKHIDYTKVDEILGKEREKSISFLKESIWGGQLLTGKQIERSILMFDSDKCSGCGYCSLICPAKAIGMHPDENGFMRPIVDPAKCVNCGKCSSRCPTIAIKRDVLRPTVYAARNQNVEALKNSSSGGAFYALAESILRQNGAVYGAAFNEKFELEHRRITDISEIRPLMGSKYLQSNAYKVFADVRKDLLNGIHVLFVGTPCQVAALREFCQGNEERLYLADFVCHGVPSPLLIGEHIKYVENYFHSKVTSYVPRSKVDRYGHSELFVFDNGKSDWKHPITQAYKYIFYSSSSIRPSCGMCPFTNFARPGDITIADFWGIERSHPELDATKGLSMVLVNTEKGVQLLEQADSLKILTEVSQGDIPEDKQPHLYRPIKIDPKKSEMFWSDFHHNGWGYVAQKYAQCGKADLLKWRLKQTKAYQFLRGRQ